MWPSCSFQCSGGGKLLNYQVENYPGINKNEMHAGRWLAHLSLAHLPRQQKLMQVTLIRKGKCCVSWKKCLTLQSRMQSQGAGDCVQTMIHPSSSWLQQDKVHSNVCLERRRKDREGRPGGPCKLRWGHRPCQGEKPYGHMSIFRKILSTVVTVNNFLKSSKTSLTWKKRIRAWKR